MIAVSVTLTLLLALVAARPNHQQFYYQAPQAPGSFYYVPQADAANVVSVQRYAAPVPVAVGPGSPQYVLLYPGGPQGNFIPGRADETTDAPTIWNLFNFFQRPTSPAPKVENATVTETTPYTTEGAVTTSTVATTVEETTPKPSNENPAKPEKIVGNDKEIMLAVEPAGVAGTTDEEKASLENLDENLPLNPQSSGPPTDGRQFTLVQRPQFFGNYDLLNQRDMQQRFGAPPGSVSSFLLFRNGFVKPGLLPGQGQPGRPLKLEAEGGYVPGAAALSFQQALSDASSRRGAYIPGSRYVDVSQVVQPQAFVGAHPLVAVPGRQVLTFKRPQAPPGVFHVGPSHQNVYVIAPERAEPPHSVVVDADRPKKDDALNVEAEQAGPSVAQAKPQAIALAGVGGMAAAAPVATAVVGPGGLAVSAPTATAVAGGPSGGGSLVGPAQAAIAAAHTQVNKGNKVKGRSNHQTYDYKDDDRY